MNNDNRQRTVRRPALSTNGVSLWLSNNILKKRGLSQEDLDKKPQISSGKRDIGDRLLTRALARRGARGRTLGGLKPTAKVSRRYGVEDLLGVALGCHISHLRCSARIR
jgi:hypothetical protein